MPTGETRSKSTQSTLSQYLKEIGATPLLTPEEEQELAKRIQDHGEEAARQQMMRANLRLVVNIAKKYAPSGDPDVLMDLIQEGNIGLMRAVDRFKPDRGTRFSTYGVYWIKQAILRSLKSRRLVRLPENVVDRVLQMQRIKQRLYQMLGRPPVSEEIAQEMSLPVERVHKLEEAATEVVSLDQTVRGGDDSEATQLKELLEDIEAPQPENVARVELIRDEMKQAVHSLPARERKILAMRFGLEGTPPHTLEDIGAEFNISRERVRQLQNTALERLKMRQNVQRAYQV